MALISTPVTIQSGGEVAEYFRRLFYTQMNGRPGVLGSGDLAVTQNGTPNMSVNVADGRCFVLGSESSTQGLYFCDNRSTTNLAIGASHATLGRYDIVVVRVRDAAYSGATNSAALEVVAGTAAASPAVPTTPDNCFVIARVLVNAAATTITNAVIDDTRTGNASYTAQSGRAAALGGVIVCTSTLRPTVGLYEGLVAYETDTDHLIIYTGSAWQDAAAIGAWTAYTPTLLQSVTVTKTTTSARWVRQGRTIHFQAALAVTGSGTAGQNITIGLPVTAQASAIAIGGSGRIFDSSASVSFTGYAETSSTTTASIVIDGANGYAGAAGMTAGLASGDIVWVAGTYEAAS